MSSMWGSRIRISVFGESHGQAIGVVIDGLPAGVKLDLELISQEMKRRRPGYSELTTARREEDRVDILSGFFQGTTTGTPLTAVILNTNTKSKDYEAIKDLIRPSHADYTGHIKYTSFNDYRGGGHFSGRLTAPLVFAGAIAKQMLKEKNITIGGHIQSIADVDDSSFNPVSIEPLLLKELAKKEFCVIDDSKGQQMKEQILKAKAENDSVGGIIEAAIVNLPVGAGDPIFNAVESTLAQLLFSIPAVKGVEFGRGFAISRMKGSEANDQMFIDNGQIGFFTNNNGGILGGIATGMPVIFRVAVKPTPSIGRAQKTVDIAKRINTTIEIQGRHDPCIVPRVLPVIEAAAALATLELLGG